MVRKAAAPARYFWFRTDTSILHNSKLLMLAPSDRWFYVGLLALKRDGTLDRHVVDKAKMLRVVSTQLRVTPTEAEELKRRLIDERLIDKDWQPIGFDKYQAVSDNSTSRTRKHRDKKKSEQEDLNESEIEVDPECEVSREQVGTVPNRSRNALQKEQTKQKEKNKKEISQSVAGLLGSRPPSLTYAPPENVTYQPPLWFSKKYWDQYLQRREKAKHAMTDEALQKVVEGIEHTAEVTGRTSASLAVLIAEHGWGAMSPEYLEAMDSS